MSEFSLIDQLHQLIRIQRDDVLLPSGDDCAVLQPPQGKTLAVSTDTLIAGRHFPLDTSPHAIGYKALAVNLSDLAAMGAEPAWVSLALTLPEQDKAWLAEFARGFGELAAQHNLQLIGGDTTRGDLSITVSIIGFLPAEQRLTRAGAEAGDDIYISGELGAAGFELQSQPAGQRPNLDYPQPRIALGQALLGIASSAIDVSDGLLADLGHILKASQKGAEISLSALPIHSSLNTLPNADTLAMGGGSARNAGAISSELKNALTAGDEYELCFTAAPEHQPTMIQIAQELGVPLTRIGSITANRELQLYTAQGERYDLSQLNGTGYNHFI